MRIIICTRPLQWSFETLWECVREAVRRVVGKVRGPQLVTKYLIRGLQELGVDYRVNPKCSDIKPTDVVYVNERVAALRYAINLKRRGLCARLWAGPALTVLPSDEHGIMCDTAIDGILFPSQWPRDFWISQRPDLAEKIKVWPVGIITNPLTEIHRTLCVVYQKNAPETLLAIVLEQLKKGGKSVRVLHYGQHSHAEYISALNHADSLVYLSESESQGMALLEAWERNVPTLVWCRGYWQYRDQIWYDGAISAPYLTSEAGMFFKNGEDFEQQWKYFSSQLEYYHPRYLVEQQFTIQGTTKLFLDYLGIGKY